MTLNNKEQAWLERFRKTMAAAPASLGGKISSFTVGDNNIVLYDLKKFEEYFVENPISMSDISDHCNLVERSDTEIESISFPFMVESTMG